MRATMDSLSVARATRLSRASGQACSQRDSAPHCGPGSYHISARSPVPVDWAQVETTADAIGAPTPASCSSPQASLPRSRAAAWRPATGIQYTVCTGRPSAATRSRQSCPSRPADPAVHPGGEERNRGFTTLVDGVLVATEHRGFFEQDYPIPAALTEARTTVRVRFEPGSLSD
jgi:hypothetical protein